MNMITSTSCIHNVHEPQHNSHHSPVAVGQWVSSLDTGTILELVHSWNTAVGESLSWLLCYTLHSLNMLLAMVLLQCSCPQCSLARAYNIHTQASRGRVTDSQSSPPRITPNPLSVTYHYSSIVCVWVTLWVKEWDEDCLCCTHQLMMAAATLWGMEAVYSTISQYTHYNTSDTAVRLWQQRTAAAAVSSVCSTQVWYSVCKLCTLLEPVVLYKLSLYWPPVTLTLHIVCCCTAWRTSSCINRTNNIIYQ